MFLKSTVSNPHDWLFIDKYPSLSTAMYSFSWLELEQCRVWRSSPGFRLSYTVAWLYVYRVTGPSESERIYHHPDAHAPHSHRLLADGLRTSLRLHRDAQCVERWCQGGALIAMAISHLRFLPWKIWLLPLVTVFGYDKIIVIAIFNNTIK